MKSNTKKASLVVLCTFATDHLKTKTLPSIIRTVNNVRYEIIVVYNGFGNLTLKNKKIRLIKSNKPLHVAYGYNLGIKHSKYDYIVLIHDDVEFLEKGWLKKCIDILKNKKIGAVGPMLYEIGASFYFKNLKYPFIQCAPLVTRRDVFENVGFFDEFYFQGLEDIDWNYSLFEKKYRLFLLPFKIRHHQGLSTNKFFNKFFSLQFYWPSLTRSLFPYFFKKHKHLIKVSYPKANIIDDGIQTLFEDENKNRALTRYLQALSLVIQHKKKAKRMTKILLEEYPNNFRIILLNALCSFIFRQYNNSLNIIFTLLKKLNSSMRKYPSRLLVDSKMSYIVSSYSMIAWCFFYLGKIYFIKKDWKKSIYYFKKAISLNVALPGWTIPFAFLYLGMIAKKNKLKKEALRFFEASLSHSKSYEVRKIVFEFLNKKRVTKHLLKSLDSSTYLIY